MFRFHVTKRIENSFVLNQDVLRHIKVARVENTNFICIYDRKFYECKLDNNNAKIIKELDLNHEHNGEVILAASIINFKRFEWLVQKATELGVTKIIPMISENISVKITNMDKKIERWKKIALNASEQSFRNIIPTIENATNFEDVIKSSIKNKFIAHEKSTKNNSYTFPVDSIFLVGPEGGFTNNEISLAKKNNFSIISLGKRILRAETASLVMLSRIT